MDNFKLQHYITVYGREAELAETVQTVFKPNNNLKKKKNCKKTDKEMLELLAERL